MISGNMDSRICPPEMKNVTHAKTDFFYDVGTCESLVLLKVTPYPDSVSNRNRLTGLLS